MTTSTSRGRLIAPIRWLARLLPAPLILFVIAMNLTPDPVTGEVSRGIAPLSFAWAGTAPLLPNASC